MTNPGLKAISADQNVSVVADTIHGKADDQRIDAWELKAARRALVNLRELLYGPPMRELLREQIEEADKRMKQYLADSNGEFTETQVILTAKGLKGSDLFSAIGASLAAVVGPPEQVRKAAIEHVFPMHPEHYSLPPYRGAMETMGGIPTRSRVFVLQQFKDTDDGLEANLMIWYPVACPPVYLEEHAEHYAVEVRNLCRMAAAAKNHQL